MGQTENNSNMVGLHLTISTITISKSIILSEKKPETKARYYMIPFYTTF